MTTSLTSSATPDAATAPRIPPSGDMTNMRVPSRSRRPASWPALVFLDVMMPKRNGFEVCRAIKQELGLADTYVVMLTAKGQAYDRAQGLEVGADVYLTKPFDPDELLDLARRVLEGEGAAA